MNLAHQPAFSFGSRQEEKIRKDTPGECYFPYEKTKRMPFMLIELSDFSAPGTYSPEKCVLNRQPSFTFGSRPEQKIRNDTPGKYQNKNSTIWHENHLDEITLLQ